jgi:excisionase family DNA binding protein
MPETHDAAWMATQLGLTAQTIKRMAGRREIPHVRVGRRIRFTEQNLADYIAARTVRPDMRRTERSQQAHHRKTA